MNTRAFTILALSLATSAHAQVPGMAGAGMAGIRGVQAAAWNPANLALPGGPSWSVGLGSASVVLGNSAFSLDDYISYNGAFIDDQTKQDILASIGPAGWRLNGQGSITLPRISEAKGLPGFYFPSFQVGGAAFFGATHASISALLTQEAAELLLDGTAKENPWSLGTSQATTAIWSEAGASFSGRIGFLTFGASGRYIEGHFLSESSATGDIAPSYDDGILGTVGTSGSLMTRSADGGSGYGVDIGATLSLDDLVTISASASNVLSVISWDNNPRESGFTFDARLDSAWADKNFPEAVEYDEAIQPFETSLPMTVRGGIAAQLSSEFQIAADLWTESLEDTPNVAAGLEWALVSWLPLRGGIEFHQVDGIGYAAGLGVHAGPIHLDAGAGLRGGPVARGLEAALQLSLIP